VSGRAWWIPRAATLLFAAGLAPAGLAAQQGTVSVERENFRSTPRGAILAEVLEGTTLALGEARDRWRQATLEGWIWAASVRSEPGGGLELSVSAPDGENLRARPNGDRLARLRTGTRLEELERQGGWVRVRRTGWFWEPSMTVTEAAPAPPATAEVQGPAAPPTPPPTGATDARGRAFATAAGRVAVLDNPAGDTLARLHPGAAIEVTGREGDWTRIRIEGWTRTASLGSPDSAAAGVLRDISRIEVQADPERFRGRVVEWTVQFVALQEAERFRTDFVEGEPFMLARGPGDDAGFVYVAIPPDRMDAVADLSPLQRVRVLARIRTALSSLTGAPVLELLEITGR
jgi:hypothetical protein